MKCITYLDSIIIILKLTGNKIDTVKHQMMDGRTDRIMKQLNCKKEVKNFLDSLKKLF